MAPPPLVRRLYLRGLLSSALFGSCLALLGSSRHDARRAGSCGGLHWLRSAAGAGVPQGLPGGRREGGNAQGTYAGGPALAAHAAHTPLLGSAGPPRPLAAVAQGTAGACPHVCPRPRCAAAAAAARPGAVPRPDEQARVPPPGEGGSLAHRSVVQGHPAPQRRQVQEVRPAPPGEVPVQPVAQGTALGQRGCAMWAKGVCMRAKGAVLWPNPFRLPRCGLLPL